MSEKNTAKGEQPEDKKSKVKRERRGGDNGSNNDSKEQERRAEENMQQEAAASKPRRKRGDNDNKSPVGDEGDGGGWMSSSNNGGKSMKAKIRYDEDDLKDTAASSANKDKHFQDDNDEIMLIPDLDEEGGGDADQRIAHAPRNVNRRIPTLAELELEVKAALPNAEDGFNLNILLGTLVPAAMVYEADVPWTFESLLREITDELSNTPKTVLSATVATPSSTASPVKTTALSGGKLMDDSKGKSAVSSSNNNNNNANNNNNNSSFMSASTNKAVKGK